MLILFAVLLIILLIQQQDIVQIVRTTALIVRMELIAYHVCLTIILIMDYATYHVL